MFSGNRRDRLTQHWGQLTTDKYIMCLLLDANDGFLSTWSFQSSGPGRGWRKVMDPDFER